MRGVKAFCFCLAQLLEGADAHSRSLLVLSRPLVDTDTTLLLAIDMHATAFDFVC